LFGEVSPAPDLIRTLSFVPAICRWKCLSADFPAGRTEESSLEEILLVIGRLVKVLPEEYQTRLIGKPNGETEIELARSH
jgi:hypothetical protein